MNTANISTATIKLGLRSHTREICEDETVSSFVNKAAPAVGCEANIAAQMTPTKNGVTCQWDAIVEDGDVITLVNRVAEKAAGITVTVKFGFRETTVEVEPGQTVDCVVRTVAGSLTLNPGHLANYTPVMDGVTCAWDARVGDSCRITIVNKVAQKAS